MDVSVVGTESSMFHWSVMWKPVLALATLIFIYFGPSLTSPTVSSTIDNGQAMPAPTKLSQKKLIAERKEIFYRICLSILFIMVAHRGQGHYRIYLISYLVTLMFKNTNPFSPNNLKTFNQALSLILIVNPIVRVYWILESVTGLARRFLGEYYPMLVSMVSSLGSCFLALFADPLYEDYMLWLQWLTEVRGCVWLIDRLKWILSTYGDILNDYSPLIDVLFGIIIPYILPFIYSYFISFLEYHFSKPRRVIKSC